MSYPERGAGYTHKPKFIERMKRAEGGGVEPQPSDLYDPEQIERIESQDKMSNGPTSEKFVDGGSYLQHIRTDSGGRGLSDWRGSFSDNEPAAKQPNKGD